MKVLLIPGFSEKAGSANTSCVSEIAKEICKMKDVELVVAGDTLNRISASIDWKKSPLFLLKKVINWPTIDPNASRQCFEQIDNLISQGGFDAMIVSHMPYDATAAAVKVKKRHPEICLALYELDPISYEIDKKRQSLGKYLYFMRIIAENKTFRGCDLIFHMECNRGKFSKRKYRRFFNKSIYIDFPLVHNKGIHSHREELVGDNSIKLVYSGKLMMAFRSPEYLLEVLSLVKKDINIEVFFYSNGDCEDIIATYSANYDFIHQMGFVSKEDLNDAIASSDCLINIGNKYSDMLPSKILTYIETGMPIIHVKNQYNDACEEYLKRYTLATIINEDEPVVVSAKKVSGFIKSNYKKRLESDFIVSKFEANTPEYSARVIIDAINKQIANR
jgi:hypothetical protein